MIDFRYHLVSLISVFLALAVGIVLGAGPLKDTIGDQLTGQVEQLRQEKDQQREQLDSANALIDNDSKYLDSIAPQLLSNTLKDRKIAIVSMPDVPDDMITSIDDRMKQAGGTTVSSVALTATWTDPEADEARVTVCNDTKDKINKAPAADADTNTCLSDVLAASLKDTNEDKSMKSVDLLDQMSSAGLVEVKTKPTQAADAVLVMSTMTDKNNDDVVKAQVVVVSELRSRVGATVVSGVSAESNDLLRAVRNNSDVAKTVSTVDSVDATTGTISVPLSLADALNNVLGQYGFRQGASAVIPPTPGGR